MNTIEGNYVQLNQNGKHQHLSTVVSDKNKKEYRTTELFSPLSSIDKFGYNKIKQWEIFKD